MGFLCVLCVESGSIKVTISFYSPRMSSRESLSREKLSAISSFQPVQNSAARFPTNITHLTPFFLANYTDFPYASAFSLKPPKPSVAPFDISQPSAPLFFNELPLNVHTCYEPTSSSECDPTAAKRFLRPSNLFFYFSFCYSFAACFIFVCRGLLRGFSVVFYAFCCYFVKRLGAAVQKSAP